MEKLTNNVFVFSVAVQYKVKCLADAMMVEIVKEPDMLDIYLEGLRSYPGELKLFNSGIEKNKILTIIYWKCCLHGV